MTVERLKAFEDSLGLYGDLTFLDAEGNKIDDPYAGRDGVAEPVADIEEVKGSLSSMRRMVTASTGGRILLGGRVTGFVGDLPGVVEEFLVSVDAGQPVYLAGGFEGAAGDIAVESVLRGNAWAPARPDPDKRYAAAMEVVRSVPKDRIARSLDNGLTEEEQRRLAVTHRASEIAALVSLGVGRRLASAK